MPYVCSTFAIRMYTYGKIHAIRMYTCIHTYGSELYINVILTAVRSAEYIFGFCNCWFIESLKNLQLIKYLTEEVPTFSFPRFINNHFHVQNKTLRNPLIVITDEQYWTFWIILQLETFLITVICTEVSSQEK